MDYSKVTLVEYEKKKREVFNILRNYTLDEFVGCNGINCDDCPLIELCATYGGYGNSEMNEPVKAAQLIMEFETPVEWLKVPVDAKILVKNDDDETWYKRHFAKYKDGKVYAWNYGETSYTTEGKVVAWTQAKLYKEGDE